MAKDAMETIKEKYEKFILIVKTFNSLENPTYYLVSKQTGITSETVYNYLNDWHMYETVYGINAKEKYDLIQSKIKKMNERKNSYKDSLIVKEAEEFLETNCSAAEFAEKKGISAWLLRKHFRKLADINPKLYELVQQKKIDVSALRFIEEANFYLEHDYTLAQAEEKLDLGKGVFYEHLKKLEKIDPDLVYLVRQKSDSRAKDFSKFIIDEAKDFLKNNYTVTEYCEKANTNRITLFRHFKLLKDIDPELYDLVNQKKENIIYIKEQDYLNQIKEQANYFLEHDYNTAAEYAEELGVNKSTLFRRFQKLEEADPELYSLIRQKQGLSLPTYSDEYIDSIVNAVIFGEYTLDELAKSSGITTNTLYNCILKSSHLSEEKKTQVKKAYQASRSNKEKDNKTI